jgi:hypothetical protein
MSKSSGLGAGLLVGGYDLSGDIGAVNKISGGPALDDVTAINKSAMERLPLTLDGGLDYTAFFNTAVAQAHPVHAGLPSTDVHVIYIASSTLGDEAACIVGKQLDYAGSREGSGRLTYNVPHPSNGFALEWANTLTAGLRTDTTATNGTGVDGSASSTTGWSAYLQVLALTGTNVIVTLKDSADNSNFATFTGSAFTSVTAARTCERIEGAAGATVRRYVRADTTGTFTSAIFLVTLTRHPTGAAA